MKVRMSFVALLLAAFCVRISPAAEHTFAVGEGEFLLDGKPFVVRCGEMHFARVGLEAWKGMKVAFLGDSITDPAHVGCTKNYWNFLVDDLALDAKVYGVNGDTWKDLPGQINRIHESMDVDLDAIFVFLGTND